jgi:hypothetical protein
MRLTLKRRVRISARERGASAVVVAIIMVPIAFGAAMISADIGKLMFERRELQNAADAAALAVAKQCYKPSTCNPGALTSIPSLANANAQDGMVTVAHICRSDEVPAGLPVCPSDSVTKPADADAITSCPWNPGLATKTYVEVWTSTLSKDGNKIVAPFKNVAAGDSGTEVNACARAGMTGGFPPDVAPVTQASCAWDFATKNGTSFPPKPPYSPPTLPAAIDQITMIQLHTGGDKDGTKCSASGPGTYAPGSFGWLDSDDCTKTIVSDTGTVSSKPGASKPTGCDYDDIADWAGEILYIPIFTSATGNGTKTDYTISGVSAFYVAGVWINKKGDEVFDSKDPSLTVGGVKHSCSKDEGIDCLWGWFLDPIIPAGSISTVPKGAKIVTLLG